jgi:hypothetical protein
MDEIEELIAAHKRGSVREEGCAPADPNKFSAEYWLQRELARPDCLLGDLLTTTSRQLLIGPTGTGKTSLGLALARAGAAGEPFLHWRPGRAARVLYIDGEMSARLARERLRQEIERSGGTPPSGLFLVNREDYPDLPPLNSENGQRFVEWIVDQLGGVDMIHFDNIQALVVGSLKEDETWAPMLPWIRSLTAKRIGQLWQHHTGHDTSRGYGDKTREWQFDTVGLMKLPEAPTPGRLIHFRLEFTKARERTPENHADFEPVDIWINELNQWQSSASPAVTNRRKKPPIPAETQRALDFLRDTMADHGQTLSRPGLPHGLIATKLEHWRELLKRRGLYDGDAAARQWFARAKARLIAEKRITVDGDMVWIVP